MGDYTWASGDSLAGSAVPVEERPGRFALTAPQCIYRHGGQELLVVDPHPSGNWMSWMFPYASLVLTDEGMSARGVPPLPKDLTFGSLSVYLQESRVILQEEYDRNVEEEVNNIIPGIGSGWQGEPFFQNCSLKFSRTSNSYTAYLFEYRRVTRDDLVIDLPHLWVPVSRAASFLHEPSNLQGRSVSSNVLDLVEATTGDGPAH